MIVGMYELVCVSVKARSQDCETRLWLAADTWLRAAADVVDVMCVCMR